MLIYLTIHSMSSRFCNNWLCFRIKKLSFFFYLASYFEKNYETEKSVENSAAASMKTLWLIYSSTKKNSAVFRLGQKNSDRRLTAAA